MRWRHPLLVNRGGLPVDEPTWERMWKHGQDPPRWREGSSAGSGGHGPAQGEGFVWAFRVGVGGGEES